MAGGELVTTPLVPPPLARCDGPCCESCGGSHWPARPIRTADTGLAWPGYAVERTVRMIVSCCPRGPLPTTPPGPHSTSNRLKMCDSARSGHDRAKPAIAPRSVKLCR